MLCWKQILLIDLNLLGFDPVPLEKRCSIQFNRDIFQSPNRKVLEFILHFLFNKLDLEKCSEVFKHCVPVLTHKHEREFTQISNHWLKDISEVAQLPSFPPSLLIGPSGEKIYELLAKLACFVMRRSMVTNFGRAEASILNRPAASVDGGNTPANLEASISDERSAFLVASDQFIHESQNYQQTMKQLTKEYYSLVATTKEWEGNLEREIKKQQTLATSKGRPLPIAENNEEFTTYQSKRIEKISTDTVYQDGKLNIDGLLQVSQAAGSFLQRDDHHTAHLDWNVATVNRVLEEQKASVDTKQTIVTQIDTLIENMEAFIRENAVLYPQLTSPSKECSRPDPSTRAMRSSGHHLSAAKIWRPPQSGPIIDKVATLPTSIVAPTTTVLSPAPSELPEGRSPPVTTPLRAPSTTVSLDERFLTHTPRQDPTGNFSSHTGPEPGRPAPLPQQLASLGTPKLFSLDATSSSLSSMGDGSISFDLDLVALGLENNDQLSKNHLPPDWFLSPTSPTSLHQEQISESNPHRVSLLLRDNQNVIFDENSMDSFLIPASP